jgi:hypothetical protein
MKTLHGLFMTHGLEFKPETGKQATNTVAGLRAARRLRW